MINKNFKIYLHNKSKDLLNKNTASMNESSKSSLRNDSFAKNISTNVKKQLNKDNSKTHIKTFSLEIKNDKSKSPNQTIKSVNNLKDLLSSNNNGYYSNISNSQNKQPSINRNSNIISNINLIHHHSNYKTTKSSNLNVNNKNKNNINNNSSSNNINNSINNNLNSFTTNGNIIKNDINLRNYIMNRVNKSNTKPQSSNGKSGNNNGNNHFKATVDPGHFRSNSNNIFV